jgi:hypothetical protein
MISFAMSDGTAKTAIAAKAITIRFPIVRLLAVWFDSVAPKFPKKRNRDFQVR